MKPSANNIEQWAMHTSKYKELYPHHDSSLFHIQKPPNMELPSEP